MAIINYSWPNDSSSKRKLVGQKTMPSQNKSDEKACEYSKMRDADICVGIRMRETGQAHILSADSSGLRLSLLHNWYVKHLPLGKESWHVRAPITQRQVWLQTGTWKRQGKTRLSPPCDDFKTQVLRVRIYCTHLLQVFSWNALKEDDCI